MSGDVLCLCRACAQRRAAGDTLRVQLEEARRATRGAINHAEAAEAGFAVAKANAERVEAELRMEAELRYDDRAAYSVLIGKLEAERVALRQELVALRQERDAAIANLRLVEAERARSDAMSPHAISATESDNGGPVGGAQ